eukprot:TRINITY_DN7975_c0_g1_i2.p1 TRINITY_DN7975_c0_g1~~TRINITY_DN7975_c0_g1_i2.p1  ORF type:complete len:1072 (+),score=224.87 TRINITY_DN7975_c0_g1_i2:188-3403(+)
MCIRDSINAEYGDSSEWHRYSACACMKACTPATTTVSDAIVSLLDKHGVRTVFGVPGSYCIHCVDTMANQPSLQYILTSHEAGAAFAALGYGQATRGYGCTVCTAGPAGLNAVTALAAAKADSGGVLMIHGEVPARKLHKGALQDSWSYGCDIRAAMRQVVSSQYCPNSAAQFSEELNKMCKELAGPTRVPGPVHLCIPMDIFPQKFEIESGVFEMDDKASRSAGLMAGGGEIEMVGMERAAMAAWETIRASEQVLVLVGNGIDQGDCFQELHSVLSMLRVPVMVTARGVSCVDHSLPSFVGQHSIFPHESSTHFLNRWGGAGTDLLVGFGTSLGEFATNSWCTELSEIPRVLHVNQDEGVFGRLGHSPDQRVDVCADIKPFLAALVQIMMADPDGVSRLNAAADQRMTELHAAFPLGQVMPRLSRSDQLLVAPLASDADRPLCGQRLVYDISESLNGFMSDREVNIVGDTGSSKLYAAHYIDYRPKWRCFMPGGTIDTMGYALPASIGIAVAMTEAQTKAPTICITGDGSLFMNNELNALASNPAMATVSLIVFVLNDSALSYVHQGFAAVMERPIAFSQFANMVDIASMARSFGLRAEVIHDPGQVTAEKLEDWVSLHQPVIVDCRVSKTTVGPGYERYNSVRGMLGRHPLSVAQMTSLLAAPVPSSNPNPNPSTKRAHPSPNPQPVPKRRGHHGSGWLARVTLAALVALMCCTFGLAAGALETCPETASHLQFGGGGGSNKLQLYGWIQDVFEGTINPTELRDRAKKGVEPELSFGVGVSAFADDTADVGDGIYFNGRFFVRRTEAGMARRRDFSNGTDESLFTEATAAEYRTGYSLGIRSLEAMDRKRFVYSTNGTRPDGTQVRMRDMLEEFIGPARTGPQDPGRVVGFVGVVDYKDFWGTSLSVAPTRGENILEVIDEYARPGDSQGVRSGICVGFVRTTVHPDWDDQVDHALYHRMFFDNPRDNSGAPTTADGGAHWISHTHGVILPTGTSLFDELLTTHGTLEAGLAELAQDQGKRNQFLEACYAREDIADCGHVIPNSVLDRYFFNVFDIDKLEVFNPSRIVL